MNQMDTESIKELEDLVLQLFEAELESIPEHYHDLIPSQISLEEKMEWIIKAKKAGFFPNQYYMNQYGPKGEGDSAHIFEPSDSRDEKLKKMIDYVMGNEIQNIPQHMQKLIPPNITLEEKLAWIRKAKEKGVFQGGMPTFPKIKMSGNKGLGTGPYTGPGTAPGTGPGTAPWLENENMNLHLKMNDTPDKAQKKLIVKEEDNEENGLEEVTAQLTEELSRVNEMLMIESENSDNFIEAEPNDVLESDE